MTGPLRVAHLTTVDMSLRYLVLPQLLAVQELGGEPVGISSPGPFVTELEDAGIRHIPLRSSTREMDLLADIRAIGELWRVLRHERPDILHTHNPKPGLYGRVLGRLAGVPVIVNTIHGLYAAPDDHLLKRLFVYGLEAFACRFSDAELVQSREDYRLLTKWRIAPPLKTQLLGNGVDLERFRPALFSDVMRARTREQLGVTPESIVVGMVGRLVAEKGYAELFAAARDLPPNYQLVCIGPDDPGKADALPRSLVEDAANNGVVFVGMRPDVDRLYNAMDIFILPSHREGFPRAAMEAAAMGLPIIATDIRGCREVVTDGTNGILFPVGDVDALVGAIERLGSNHVLRSKMSKASMRLAAERFDERVVVDTVLRAYADVAAAKGIRRLGAIEHELHLRPARVTDATIIARLHLAAISSGFLPVLGHRFLSVLYRALIGWPDGWVFVAEGGHITGFVAGVADTSGFYRHFLFRHGLAALWTALPRLWRPRVAAMAWETARYGSPSDIPAELLATAVASDGRGRGVARRLGRHLLESMQNAGVGRVKVVVGAENEAARGLYRSLGFTVSRQLEVHSGEESLELVWSAP